jgi:2-polyprenyl-6-hydroxyphenyl methylase/3-demethylubiquinone-9 3-methyltransferase
MDKSVQAAGPNADHRFVEYYAQQSASEQTQRRFESAQRVALTMRRRLGLPTEGLDVVDVGCGAGTQAIMWSEMGHRAQGIDISAPLIELANERSRNAGLSARFSVGSAGRLPLPDASADVVLVSELLEHIAEWQPCVDEAVRVLRPGGVLYMSTTNRLCPVQQEFDLPLYSWYPGFVKRRCEQMAVTTHGRWVQYTSYPAVHWFSFYQLRDYLDRRGFGSLDRFDVIDTTGSALKRAIVGAIRALPPLRFAGHVLTPYTMIVAHRRS